MCSSDARLWRHRRLRPARTGHHRALRHAAGGAEIEAALAESARTDAGVRATAISARAPVGRQRGNPGCGAVAAGSSNRPARRQAGRRAAGDSLGTQVMQTCRGDIRRILGGQVMKNAAVVAMTDRA
ncbi:hypothetical protein ACU4GD_35640 [Cupriavidus basilensis]